MLFPGAYPAPALPGRLCDDWYMAAIFQRLERVRETDNTSECKRILREALAYLTGDYLQLADAEMGEGVRP